MPKSDRSSSGVSGRAKARRASARAHVSALRTSMTTAHAIGSRSVTQREGEQGKLHADAHAEGCEKAEEKKQTREICTQLERPCLPRASHMETAVAAYATAFGHALATL
eukprot:4323998-Pleurochrysis_carterae.AAC.2